MKKSITIALIYDFDGTLSPGNMQEYDFIPTVGMSSSDFWKETNKIASEQDADPILTYMSKMIHEAKFAGISLKKDSFRAYGAKVPLYSGVDKWFARMNAYAADRGIVIEHYINSSGLKEMIEGTPIAKEFKKIYACSFLYDVDGVAYWPAVAINYTNKTQFIFKISKGVESVYDSTLVNKYIPEEKRHIRFRHMIYIGDGTTDIPCMRLVKEQGGHSIAVYNPESVDDMRSCESLVKDRRVSYVCPADYTKGSNIDAVVKTIIDKIEIDTKLQKLMIQPIHKIIFATNNRHKLREVREILGGRYNLLTPNDCGIFEDIPEEQPTIEGNALQKARYIYEKTGCDCFADDTGLEVTALNGAPGVYSARYAGEKCNFQDNVDKLLRELSDKDVRTARFKTVIALIIGGKEFLFEGLVYGEIISEEIGVDGFGYDPIFRPDGFADTFAEMSSEQKNKISHRGIAVSKLAEFLTRDSE